MRKLSSLTTKSGIYEIDPEGAAKLLESPGAKNRPVRAATVRRYSRRMKDRLWSMSGEPIILTTEGNLLDGEHRLRACVDSGTAFQTVVIYGEFQFKSMGQGAARSGGDVIALMGSGQGAYVALSAIATICIVHDRALKLERSPYSMKGAGPRDKDNSFDIDNAERANWVKKNGRIEELYALVRQHSGPGKALVSSSPLTAAWFLAERVSSPEKAAQFYEGVASGAGLSSEDVRLRLRSALSNMITQGLTRPTGLALLHWLAKAWSIGNRPCRHFAVRSTEAFPFFR